MTAKSGMPSLQGFDPALVNYLDKIGKDRADIRTEFDALKTDINAPPSDLSGSGDAITTISSATAAALTNSTGGSANATVQDVTVAFNQTILNNNFSDIIAPINALIIDVDALRTSVSEINDAVQTRMSSLESKLNATLAALRAAGE